MLVLDNDNATKVGQKYNVVINGKITKRNIPKNVAEHYILGLGEKSQMKAKMIPVTDEGKEILLG